MTQYVKSIRSRITDLILAVCLMIGAAAVEPGLVAAEKGDKKAWKKYREEGQKALKENRFEDADKLLRQAFDEAEKFGLKDDRFVKSASDLSDFLLRSRQYPLAETVHRQLLDARLQTIGEMQFPTAETEYQLADTCIRLGKYDDAEKYFQQARKVVEIKAGVYHPYVGFCLYGLGNLSFFQKRFPEAEKFYQQALELIERQRTAIEMRSGDPAVSLLQAYRVTYRIDYLWTAKALIGLAESQDRQNHETEAEATYRHLEQIAQKEFPEKSEVVPQVLKLVGDYHYEQLNFAASEVAYRRLLRWQEKHLGADRPELTNVLNRLIAVYTQENRALELESTCKQLMSLNEKQYGADSFEITPSLSQLADLYFKQEKFAVAEPLYSRCLVIEEKTRGEKNLVLMGLISNLATIYRKQNNDPQLEVMLKKQMAIYESVLGDKSPVLGKLLTDYADLLRRGKRDAEAIKAEARAKEIQSAQFK